MTFLHTLCCVLSEASTRSSVVMGKTFAAVSHLGPIELREMSRVSLNYALMIMLGIPILTACGSSSQQLHAQVPDSESPITITYALNESHSNSWVQQSAEGVVGIVYGAYVQGADRRADAGDLVYRTIQPDGSVNEDVVTTDRGVDKSVLLYDSNSRPRIFYASSDNSDQVIYYLYRGNAGGWLKEAVVNFANQGGRYIYELSADIGKDDAIHLLVLKSRSNPDSADFFDAYLDSHLYHVTNGSGSWITTLIHRYDTFYTYDMAVKTQRRQDIAVDHNGYAHVVFGEQYKFDPATNPHAVGVLHYATNRSSSGWVREVALKSETTTDDAGWYPSLAVDRAGVPVVASTYVARVPTHSLRYAQLCYSVRVGEGLWETTVVADEGDGYYGTDGRQYTGALPHLELDLDDTPHIVFSDVASSHNPQNVLSTGQIRYAVLRGSTWDVSTIYRQPSPQGFYQGLEMAGQCLVISSDGERIQVVGQELNSTAENVYSCRLIHHVIR